MVNKRYCFICKTRKCEADNVIMHEFPSNSIVRQLWIDNIQLSGVNVNFKKVCWVCNKHFEKNCYIGEKKLKPSAVPTIFQTTDSSEIVTTSLSELEVLQNSSVVTEATFKDESTEVSTLSQTDFDKLQQENEALKRRNRHLLNIHQQTNKKIQNLQMKLNNSYFPTLIKIIEDSENNNTQATLLFDQIRNYNKNKPTWSEVTVRNCNAWRMTSPKGYEYSQHIIKLPCQTTLNKYVDNADSTELIEVRIKSESETLPST